MPLSDGRALLVAVADGQAASLLVPLLLVYSASMILDSAALTVGLLNETAPELHGTALAFYSTIGFVGPVVFGMALDAFGRASQAGWAAGFVTRVEGVGFGHWAIAHIKPLLRSPR